MYTSNLIIIFHLHYYPSVEFLYFPFVIKFDKTIPFLKRKNTIIIRIFGIIKRVINNVCSLNPAGERTFKFLHKFINTSFTNKKICYIYIIDTNSGNYLRLSNIKICSKRRVTSWFFGLFL